MSRLLPIENTGLSSEKPQPLSLMYIPQEFRQQDRESALAFMRAYPFAALVSVSAGSPVASHLPFHIEADETEIRLSAHFAKGNKQWKDLKEAMVIFSGPQAYVSPGLYDKADSVPTWNYVAVHVWGRVQIVTGEAEGFRMLEALMAQSEPAYKAHWEGVSAEYKLALYQGIVPFRLLVTRFEAQEKLSQNKTAGERARIAAQLRQGDEAAAETAAYMEQRGEPPAH